MDIIGKKYYYFALSLLVLVPGFIALMLWGLNLSVDFTGGSMITLTFASPVNDTTVTSVRNTLVNEKLQVATIEKSGNTMIVRTGPIDQNQNSQFMDVLSSKYVFRESEFETVGPTIGSETTADAIKAVIISSVLIVLYIAWSFRKVPKPASSFKFGICAIIALIHDVFVVVGIFAILGHFFKIEVDSLFVTALLTIIGFSVHDTIVVFDRIRENLRKTSGNVSFTKIVNDSILQTIDRSLNTSLTVLLVLFTLLLFTGESIRWFIVALLIGVTSGTYSSIFNASPLLVMWEEWSRNKSKKK